MSKSLPTHPVDTRVAVVLCTYNGAEYVEAQVESLLAQVHPVSIRLCDDVSSDDTIERISGLLRADIDTINVNKQNTGFVRNFEHCLSSAMDSDENYFALSDQDDVWDRSRIACGMSSMAALELVHGRDVPLLVHSDLNIVDAQGQLMHGSFLAYRRYRIAEEKSLPVILGENGVMGNTILMNRAMAELCLPFPDALHVHDYWIAILAELFGHRAKLDLSLVNYRLHGSNASNTAASMGRGISAFIANSNWNKLVKRNFKLPFKEDSRLKTLEYLTDNSDQFPALSLEQRRSIEAFKEYLRFKQSRFSSLRFLLTSNFIRKDLAYRLRLVMAVLLTQRYTR